MLDKEKTMDAANSKTGSSKRCCTVIEIQDILCISRPAAYGLIKKKAFRTVFAGGRYLTSKSSFDDWLDGCEAEAKEAHQLK